MEALPHLFPLFHGIHSITLDENYSYDYFLFNHYPATMRKARVLNYSGWFASHGPTGAVFLLERFYFWLCDRRDDGEPRLLAMDLSRGEQCVLQEIRQICFVEHLLSVNRSKIFKLSAFSGLQVNKPGLLLRPHHLLWSSSAPRDHHQLDDQGAA